MRTRDIVAVFIALGEAACNRGADPAGPPASTGASAPAQSALPARTAECAEDTDCEVLVIEVTGPHACCPSCRTAAGTRAWAAGVKARCAGASGSNCYPLACPMGPTRPRCDAGRCIAVP